MGCTCCARNHGPSPTAVSSPATHTASPLSRCTHINWRAVLRLTSIVHPSSSNDHTAESGSARMRPCTPSGVTGLSTKECSEPSNRTCEPRTISPIPHECLQAPCSAPSEGVNAADELESAATAAAAAASSGMMCNARGCVASTICEHTFAAHVRAPVYVYARIHGGALEGRGGDLGACDTKQLREEALLALSERWVLRARTHQYTRQLVCAVRVWTRFAALRRHA